MYVDIYQHLMYDLINMDKFLISPEDGLILIAIKQSPSLREASRQLSCDPAGLLRKVQRLAEDHQLIIKRNGRWGLTPSGELLADWTRQSILSQKKLLNSSSVLRMASTMWFAEQALIPRYKTLKKILPDLQQIHFKTSSGKDLEHFLLQGDADVVTACHAPENPLIAHKVVSSELWVAAFSPDVVSSSKKVTQLKQLFDVPYLRHMDLNPEILAAGVYEELNISNLAFDNLIGLRAALREGLGWSFVPSILIHEDLKSGRLMGLDHPNATHQKVCIWWLRNNQFAKEKISKLSQWLNQEI